MKQNDEDFHLYSDFTEPVYRERSPAGSSVLLPITMIVVVVVTYLLVEHSRPVQLSSTPQLAAVTNAAQRSFVMDPIAPLDFELDNPVELDLAGSLTAFDQSDVLIANHTLPTVSELPPSMATRPSIEIIPNLQVVDPQPTISSPQQSIPVARAIPANFPAISPPPLPNGRQSRPTSQFPFAAEGAAMQQISQLLYEEINRSGGIDLRFRAGGGVRIDRDPTTSRLQLSHDFSQPAVPTANLAINHQCKAIPLVSHPHSSEQFTPWLTPYDLNHHILEINRGHSAGFWERGHWITAIEGRESNGLQQYRIVYEKMPQATQNLQWCYQIAQTRQDFQRKLEHRQRAGFELIQSQVFQDRHNQPRYQAVWKQVTSK